MHPASDPAGRDVAGALAAMAAEERSALRRRFLGGGPAGDVPGALATLAQSLGVPDAGQGPALEAAIDEALAEREGWRPPGAAPTRVPEVVALLTDLDPALWPAEPPPVADVRSIPPSPAPPGRRSRRVGPFLMAVLAFAIVAAVVGAVLLHRAAPSWRVVPSAAGLRGYPTLLDCPTGRVCWATSVDSQSDAVFVSDDGARRWRRTREPLAGQATAISCRSAADCLVGLESDGPEPSGSVVAIARTTDAGAHWAVARLPVLAGQVPRRGQIPPVVDQVLCWSAFDCVAHATEVAPQGPVGLFFVSNDGGATWRSAATPSGGPAVLSALTCTDSGDCLGVGLDEATLFAVRSTDGGRSWRLRPTPVYPEAIGESLPASCAGDRSCMALLYGLHGAELARTTDGGGHWSISPVPHGWEQATFALSCASSADCSATTADIGSGPDPYHPAVEATRNSGRTWRRDPVAVVGSTRLLAALRLSCTPAACYAIGITSRGGTVSMVEPGG